MEFEDDWSANACAIVDFWVHGRRRIPEDDCSRLGYLYNLKFNAQQEVYGDETARKYFRSAYIASKEGDLHYIDFLLGHSDRLIREGADAGYTLASIGEVGFTESGNVLISLKGGEYDGLFAFQDCVL